MNSIWHGYLKPAARTIGPALLGIVAIVLLFAIVSQGMQWLYPTSDLERESMLQTMNLPGFVLGVSVVGILVLLLMMHSSAKDITVRFPSHLYFLPRKTGEILVPILMFKALAFALAMTLLWGIISLFPDIFPYFHDGIFLQIREEMQLWYLPLFLISTFLFLQGLVWAIAWWGVTTSILVLAIFLLQGFGYKEPVWIVCGLLLLATLLRMRSLVGKAVALPVAVYLMAYGLLMLSGRWTDYSLWNNTIVGHLYFYTNWLPWAVSGALMSYAAVCGQRHGQRLRWRMLVQWMQRGPTYEIFRISGPVKAQAWYEWRRGLWTFPMVCLVLALVLLLLHASDPLYNIFTRTNMLFPLALAAAFVIGYLLDRPSKLYTEFSGIRPVSSARLAAGRILAGGISAGIAAIIVCVANLPNMDYPDYSQINNRTNGNFHHHEYRYAKFNGIDLDERYAQHIAAAKWAKQAEAQQHKKVLVPLSREAEEKAQERQLRGGRGRGGMERGRPKQYHTPSDVIRPIVSASEIKKLELTHFLFRFVLSPVVFFGALFLFLMAGRYLAVIAVGALLGVMAGAPVIMITAFNMVLGILAVLVLGGIFLVALRKEAGFLKVTRRYPRYSILVLFSYSAVFGLIMMTLSLLGDREWIMMFQAIIYLMISLGTLFYLKIATQKLCAIYVIVQGGAIIFTLWYLYPIGKILTEQAAPMVMLFVASPLLILATPAAVEWQRRA